MDCREFRKKHVGFVDNTLPGVDVDAMRRHVDACPSCAAHDASVRRALLVVRNVTPIEPSREFSRRLAQRLDQERARTRQMPALARGPGVGTFIGMAASVVAIGVMSATAIDRFSGDREPARLPAVVALPPAQLDSTTAPAVVASMSTGMLAWPALWLAEQAPLHFVTVEIRQASYQATQP